MSQAVTPSIQCFFQQQGDNGSGTTVAQYVFVLEYGNSNSFAVNIPVSTGSANANNSYNEIDFVTYNGSVSYRAAYSAELPTSFSPGNIRNAGAVVVNTSDLPSVSSNNTLAWHTRTPGHNDDEYDQFSLNNATGNGLSTGTQYGNENTEPIAIPDLDTCSASDADAARRLLARRSLKG